MPRVRFHGSTASRRGLPALPLSGVRLRPKPRRDSPGPGDLEHGRGASGVARALRLALAGDIVVNASQTMRRHEGTVGGVSTVSGSADGMIASFVPDTPAAGSLTVPRVAHLPAADREIAMALADALAQDEGHVCRSCPPWPD